MPGLCSCTHGLGSCLTLAFAVMLSTPPPRATSAPSCMISWAARTIACSPEEQKRFTVAPATLTGSPARIDATLATLYPCEPSGKPQPRNTSSISAVSSFGTFRSTSVMQCAARSSGRVRLNEPRNDFAKGVRELATTTASLMGRLLPNRGANRRSCFRLGRQLLDNLPPRRGYSRASSYPNGPGRETVSHRGASPHAEVIPPGLHLLRAPRSQHDELLRPAGVAGGPGEDSQGLETIRYPTRLVGGGVHPALRSRRPAARPAGGPVGPAAAPGRGRGALERDDHPGGLRDGLLVAVRAASVRGDW